MSRHVKRSRVAYGIGAVWVLFAHWIDLYWNAMPFATENGVMTEHFAFSPVDALAFVGVLGILFGTFGALFTRRHIVPIRDPRLGESVRHENF